MFHRPTSLIQSLLVAVSVGAFVGATQLLIDFSWKHLFAGMAAGPVFTGVLFVLLPILSRKRWRFACGWAIAGMIAGAAWWYVAKPSVSVWRSIGIGAVLATLMVLSEWLAEHRKTKYEGKPG